MALSNTRESLYQDLQDYLLIRKEDALNNQDSALTKAINQALRWLEYDNRRGTSIDHLIKICKANATDYARVVKQHQDDDRRNAILSSELYATMVRILEDPS